MIWLTAVPAIVAWLTCGYFGVKLAELTMRDGPSHDPNIYVFVLGGPIMILVGALYAFGDEGHLLMNSADRKNPFHTELQEALRLYRLLQWVPGEDAQKEREELKKTIEELRAWPAKLKRHDGDRLISAMKSELESSMELSRMRLEAFEKIESELTDEVKKELNP